MEKKKKFQIPTTCALLFMLMIVCAVLTWIIPAGAYETEKVGNLNKVIAGTFQRCLISREVEVDSAVPGRFEDGLSARFRLIENDVRHIRTP